MMSDPTRQGETPSVVVSRKRRISLVWIAPVLAAVAVGYMVHDALRNRGPMITIVFDNAEGIVAGKTPIKFEGVQVGTVKTVAVDVATGTVTLQSRLDASAHGLAAEGSQFWIQTPQIGASGISSLDTLISGPYVACLAGDGARRTEFEGLPDRPPVPDSRPGLRISLHTEVVRDLRLGSPVLYRGITVGAVDAITLRAADGRVVVDAFVDKQYASLVQPDTVFWEVSGLQAGYEIGEGLVLNTDSIRPMLTGAVAFLSGPVANGALPVANGTVYPLYSHPSIGWTPAHLRNPGATDVPTEMIDHLASILRKADEGGVIDSTVEAMNALRLASVEADRTLNAANRLLEQDGALDQTVAGLGLMAVELQQAASAVSAALDEIEKRQLLDKTDTLLTQLDTVAPELVKAMADLGDTLERIDGLVRTNERPLTDTIRALRDASLRLNALLEDLRANPSQLLSKPPSRELPRSKP
jgi:ABC-type transporter Mla subunit MlaD